MAERPAWLLGLDAPLRHRADVITEDMLDVAIAQMEVELAEKEARLGRQAGRIVARELSKAAVSSGVWLTKALERSGSCVL